MSTKHQVAHLIFRITVNDMSRDGEIFRKVSSQETRHQYGEIQNNFRVMINS